MAKQGLAVLAWREEEQLVFVPSEKFFRACPSTGDGLPRLGPVAVAPVDGGQRENVANPLFLFMKEKRIFFYIE